MNILIIGLGVSEQLMVLCSKRPVTTLHITFGKEVIKKTVISSGVYSHRACIIKSPYPTD